MIQRTVFLCLAGFCIPAFAEDLPAVFEHDRISLVVEAPNRSALKFYTDTGGGWNAIRKTVAEELKLELKGKAESDDGSVSLVQFPDFLVRAGVPRPTMDRWLGGQLAAVADSELDEDGLLGSRWFAGHVWRIDYPNKKFSFLSGWRPSAESQPVPLGFRQGVDGKRNLNFSKFGAYSAKTQGSKLGKIADALTDRTMPLPSYLWIHHDAKLTDVQNNVLIDWANALQDTVEAGK